MLTVAESFTGFRPTLPPDDLNETARRVLLFAESVERSTLGERYRRAEFDVAVRVEVGSTRFWVVISATATILLQYGNYRSSLDHLARDAREVVQILTNDLPSQVPIDEPPAATRSNIGLVGELHRLFVEVERRRMSPDVATMRATRLLRSKAPEVFDELPNVEEELAKEFREAHTEAPLIIGPATPPRPRPKPRRDEERPPAILPTGERRVRRKRTRRGIVVTRGPEGEIVVSPYER